MGRSQHSQTTGRRTNRPASGSGLVSLALWGAIGLTTFAGACLVFMATYWPEPEFRTRVFDAFLNVWLFGCLAVFSVAGLVRFGPRLSKAAMAAITAMVANQDPR